MIYKLPTDGSCSEFKRLFRVEDVYILDLKSILLKKFISQRKVTVDSRRILL